MVLLKNQMQAVLNMVVELDQ